MFVFEVPAGPHHGRYYCWGPTGTRWHAGSLHVFAVSLLVKTYPHVQRSCSCLVEDNILHLLNDFEGHEFVSQARHERYLSQGNNDVLVTVQDYI